MSKIYECSECKRTFTQNGSLTKHRRIHDGTKPYACIHCTKSFSQSSNLIRHMRLHTGEKPYRCQICGKSFASGSNLLQHEQVHYQNEDRKKYICKISDCNKTFYYRASLRKHIESTHCNSAEFKDAKNFYSEVIELNKRPPKIAKYQDSHPCLAFTFNQSFSRKVESAAIDSTDVKLLLNQVESQPTPTESLKFISDFDVTEGCHKRSFVFSELSKITVLRVLDPIMHPHIHQDYCSHIKIHHHNHIDHLHDGMLHFVVEYGPIYEHELEESLDYSTESCPFLVKEKEEDSSKEIESDSTVQSVNENEKFNEFLELICILGKISNEERALISLKGYLSNEELSKLTNEDWSNQQDSGELLNTIMLMKQHHHIHSNECGHKMLSHAGHFDYIVDGYLHHQHGNHCDLHGFIEVETKEARVVKEIIEKIDFDV